MDGLKWNDINRLAIPAIFMGIAEPLIALADNAIIGNVLGTAELGGVGISSSFFLLIVWVLAQTKTAISALVSRHFGSKNLSLVRHLIPQALTVNFLIGCLMILCTFPFAKEIMRLYNAEGDLLIHAVTYYKIRAFGFPVVLVLYSLFGIFRGLQNTTWAMYISSGGAILNLGLDFLFVYGINGIIDPMGVYGIGLASLIAQIFMLVFAFGFYFIKTDLGWRISNRRHPYLKKYIVMSVNLFARTIALNIAYFLGMRYAASYGKAAAAAHTIAINLWLFTAFFIDGYANAGNALAGKFLGSKDKGSLIKLGAWLTKISVLSGIGLAVFFIATYPFIGRWFTHDPEVIQVLNSFFWIVIIILPINGVAFAFDGIFKGLGRTELLRNTLIIGTLFIYFPVIYFADLGDLGIHGVWLAFLIWMIWRGGSLMWVFNKMK